MEKKELKDLGLRISEKLINALNQDDYQEAISLCRALSTEYRTMHSILTNVIKALLDELTPLISTQQKNYSEDIRAEIIRENKNSIIQLLNDKTDCYSELHDIYVEFVAKLISYLYRYHGDKKVYGVLKSIGEQQKERFLEAMSLPIETIVKNSAMIMRSHPKGKLTIEEDNEKYIIVCDPCGSGGILLNKGYYDSPNLLAMINDPQPMTWYNKGFPSYCIHCAIWNEILPVVWTGRPYWVHKPPKKKNDQCVLHIYKDPSQIPKEHYDLLKG